MKNIIVYYIFIFVPMTALAIGAKTHLLSALSFSVLLLTYALIYHPLLSGLRLVALNKITKEQLWLNFIPGWNWKYFSDLFWV
jgi:hypothetical protein